MLPFSVMNNYHVYCVTKKNGKKKIHIIIIMIVRKNVTSATFGEINDVLEPT